MPAAVAAVASAIGSFLATHATAAALVKFAIRAVAFVALDAVINKLSSKKGGGAIKSDLTRDVTTRGAIEGRKTIYGEALVSGPVVFSNTSGANNKFLWYALAIAGHECFDFTDIWLDDVKIPVADINWGAVTGGSGKFVTYSLFDKELGSSTQTANSLLVSSFPTYFGSEHRGRGIAYLVARLELVEESNSSAFNAGAPRNIKVLVQGKLIYDPRRDPTSSRYGGSGSQSLGTPSTWEYSNNPTLCAADYMIDSRVGMKIPTTKIDYDVIADEAEYCDGLSNTDSGTAKRFTCDGVVYSTNTHRDNLLIILSSMNGTATYTNGKHRIRAGRIGSGPNLVANGKFDTDTAWTKGSGVTISGGVASLNIAAITGLSQSSLLTSGVSYHVSFQVLNYVSGSIRPRFGTSGANGTLVTSDGFYNEIIKATGSTFEFDSTTTFVGDIDNVELHFVTDVTINENWLSGGVKVNTAPAKRERFNTLHAIIRDPARLYKDSQTLRVTQLQFTNRDGEVLVREVVLPMTNSEITAQRILFKKLFATDQQKTVVLPCNYYPMDLAVNDYIRLTIAEFSWSEKLFKVVRWKFSDIDAGGVELVLVEDASSAYSEPDQNDFSIRDASGAVIFGDPGVPPPTNLTATAKYNGILIEVDLPTPSTSFDRVELWASPSSSWGSAVLLGSGRYTSYLHPLDAGTQRYYWARAISDIEQSVREPNSDTSTVTATSGVVLPSQTTIGGEAIGVITDGVDRAINSINEEYIYYNEISTTIITAEADNPANGVVIDKDGIRGYDNSVLKFEIPTASGAPMIFNGDINTDSHVRATGGYNQGGTIASIVGIPDDDTSTAILGITDSGVSVWGVSVTGFAVEGWSLATGGRGVFARGQGGGDALYATAVGGGNALFVSGPSDINGDVDISGDLNVIGDLDIVGNATVSGSFNPANLSTPGNLDVTGNAQIDGTLTIDGSFNPANLSTPGNLDVTGNAQIDGTLTVDDNTTINANLIINGNFDCDGVCTVDEIAMKSPRTIRSNSTSQSLVLSGGTTVSLGANLRLYSQSHGSLAGWYVFRTATTNILTFDPSVPVWTFETEVGINGALDVSQSVTTDILILRSPQLLSSDSTTQSLHVTGGTSASLGFNTIYYSQSHALTPNDCLFRAGTTDRLHFDDSALIWGFKTSVDIIGNLDVTLDITCDDIVMDDLICDTITAAGVTNFNNILNANSSLNVGSTFTANSNAVFNGDLDVSGSSILNQVTLRSPYLLRSFSATDSLHISGGTSASLGFNVILYSQSHSSLANDFLCRSGTSDRLHFDNSALVWGFKTSVDIIGNLDVTLDITCDDIVMDDLNCNVINADGTVTFTGAGGLIVTSDISCDHFVSDSAFIDDLADTGALDVAFGGIDCLGDLIVDDIVCDDINMGSLICGTISVSGTTTHGSGRITKSQISTHRIKVYDKDTGVFVDEFQYELI